MRKIYYLLSLLVPVSLLLTAYHTGSPGGKTGSPGDNLNKCNDCHIGAAIHQEDWISANIPPTGYLPGETYTITLIATDETAALFGFEVTAEDESGNKVGEFVITNDVETQFTNNMTAVTHTENGITPVGNTKQWNVDWTAPEESSENITFYASFNAANGDGTNTGDIIHYSDEEYMLNTVGIESISTLNYRVFPNPATDYILVEQQNAPTKVSGRLTALNGKLIHKQELSGRTSKIDLSGIPNGVYLLHLQGDKINAMEKIVVR